MRISKLPTISHRLVAAAVATAVPIAVVISTLAMPAAAQTSGFGDVPDDAYFSTPVADLHAEGVFNDTLCEEGFCPGVPIDRRTMAVWTIRVLDGEDPPATTQSRFDDVDPASYHAPFIERMAELHVTRGCGDPSRFCPDRNVTRAEMAAFLSRAFNLLDGPNPGFDDLPDGAWYASDVAKLAASGITTGCGDGTIFCPGDATTRAQMATFLHRAITRTDGFAIGDGELAPLFALGLQKPVDVKEVEVWVYYCGPTSDDDFNVPGHRRSDLIYDQSDLRDAVDHLRTYISPFYRTESGYQEDSMHGSDLTFVEGGILSPDVEDWTTQTVGAWYTDAVAGKSDPCRDEVRTMDGYPNILLLAPIPMGGTAGYAPDAGPALAATAEIHRDNDDYLHTVAHEIGHAFYYWDHPWDDDDLPPPKTPADRALIEASISAERLKAVMSYPAFGANDDFRADAPTGSRAYVACDHRAEWEWVDENCEIPESRPGRPNAPRVTPGDGVLIVGWDPPSEGADGITSYDLRYRRADGSWRDWQVGRSLETTITGLTNGVPYQVSVRANNRYGLGKWSAASDEKAPQTGPKPTVTLRVGDSAQGEQGADGTCTSVHCRWLHIKIENLGSGPHTLACAHNGVEDIGVSRGVYKSHDAVSVWPANRRCLFGYPGSEVFVVVGAERQGDTWVGGHYSNVVEWPRSEYEPVLSVWRGGPGVAGDCTSSSGCEWVHGSGSDWPAGEQFWIRCGTFVNTQQNDPVPYRDRFVDSAGNLEWGDRICLSNFEHSVEVWTSSGVRKTVTVQAPEPPVGPELSVRRGSVAVDENTCPASAGCRWIVGSGSGWPAGEQFWIRCGTFVNTQQNDPVPYRDRFVDSAGNLGWGEKICYTAGRTTVEVWTSSGVRKTVTSTP